MRIVKRSSCASGSGYVPSYSIGFCVAMTMNGRASSYEMPSTVTCCSCMHSSSAACVFGEARLISSTSKRFANTGPGLNSNSLERWSKTFTPVTSEGSRSGVNCMREKEASRERAIAFASIVLPTPGKSSRMRWPSLMRQSTQSRSVSGGACSTRPRLSTRAWTVSVEAGASARSLCGSASLTQQLLGRIYDRRGDSVFRRFADPALPGRRDQHYLVVAGVEADVVARHVVVDDEVDSFAVQFLARAREAFGPGLRRKADEHLAVGASLAERVQHVGCRLELDAPAPVVLRTLGIDVLGRAVVGDRGSHQHEVGVPAGERCLRHRLGGRSPDDLDAARQRDGQVRGEERDVRATLLADLGEGDAHPSARAVAEEAHRVERLAR